MTKRSLEQVALQIFGSKENPAYEKWVGYWKESRARNTSLLKSFGEIVPLNFNGKKVLDIGCGTGGLSEIIADRCKTYCGIDYHRHVLQFAPPGRNTIFVQCDGARLPFPDGKFDFIFAFDIIEHLEGGQVQQRRFLAEVRRVLSPLGMVFLTTPNYWYPYDAHSNLYFPQLIPRFLRDRYIKIGNPDFLKEHKTFDTINLLTPRFFRTALEQSALTPLHQLPCCLDIPEYREIKPVRGLLAHVGLGWYFHAEFWTILVHREVRLKLRLKLRKTWFYEKNQPDDSGQPQDFAAAIDFDQGMFNHQLGPGWHWHERDKRGFRWTEDKATCYLQSSEKVRYVHVSGYSPIENRLYIDVDGIRVGEHAFGPESGFDVKYLLPFAVTDDRIFEIVIGSLRTGRAQSSADKRKLSLMIFSIKVS